MAMGTLTSACNTNISRTLSYEDKHNDPRNVSFSSYLNGAEESFVLKLAESSENPSPFNTAQQEHLYMGRKKVEDGEIDVFGAERYFNGRMEKETPRVANKCVRKYQSKEDEPADLDPMKPKTQPGTPSVRSESSWNSQSVLLQSGLRNPTRHRTNKVHGKRFLSSLSCKCACSDKDSVDIDENAGENNFNRSASCGVVHGKAITNEPIETGPNPVGVAQIIRPRSKSWVKEDMRCQKFDKLGVGLNRENCYTSPTINSGVGNFPVKMHFQEEKDESPRKSLPVFGSPVLEKRNKPSLSLEKKLTMLSWDATTGDKEIEIPPASNGMIYNDSESDASSDLFEIESLTGKANPFFARQASDGTSPTTCYAPSEASIEWSVITASAAEFSVMSDYEEQRRPPATIVTSPSKKVATTTIAKATTTNKETPRRRPGILLGCKSHKAVRVAGEAYRTNDKAIFDPQGLHRPDSFMPVTRFQAEAKLIGFDSRHGQHAFATRLIPRSEAALASSHLLYIQ
ncbi:hypothetical protein L1049_006782 [Liquidambar formosana]|uniref:Protein PHYTOCHROME KINASE SUBSTRATE 1-like n=1 Tax=Liquidambar formosana TaxID=63359 RepID=A0AAP0RHT8_LIQFO